MNRFFVPILLALLPALTISSCCKKKVYCDSLPLDFAFTGFSRTEVRSFTIRQFIKGDQWGRAIDSAQYIYQGQATGIGALPDTFYLDDYRTISNSIGILPDYDWGIYLPATGETYFITTIFDDGHRSEFVRCGDNETSCRKNITHYSINSEWKDGGFAIIPKRRK